MLKYTLPSPFIQNILGKKFISSPKRSLNYILVPSYVKIYTLLAANSYHPDPTNTSPLTHRLSFSLHRLLFLLLPYPTLIDPM